MSIERLCMNFSRIRDNNLNLNLSKKEEEEEIFKYSVHNITQQKTHIHTQNVRKKVNEK